MAHRAVRVFLSSTFRDMHGERDHLVTVVFPELRERLARLDLEFFDIDLRWGVPQHDANGEMANSWAYCKQWIDQVQPFFLCLLGERYGWIPPASAILDSNDRHRWSGRSITEMEIRHGVLDDPGNLRRSFFYLRAAATPRGIPNAIYREFVDPDERERLEQLKAEIRASGRPVRDYPCQWQCDRFVGWEEFGRMVLDDLWSGVLRDPRFVPPELWEQATGINPAQDVHYRDSTTPVPPEVWTRILDVRQLPATSAWERERRQMHDFAEERRRWFHGRQQELDELIGFVDRPLDDDQSPVCVVNAPPGQGKSALLAKLAPPLMEKGHWVIEHYVGATEGSDDVRTMLRNWNAELRSRGLRLPEDGPGPETATNDLRSLGQMLAARLALCPAEDRLVILLDGVNQLAEAHDLQWLPEQVGPAARVIVSCAEDADDPVACRVLEALRHRRPKPTWIHLGPLQAEDIRQVVVAYLHEYCKELDRDHVDAICHLAQARNPLYLLVLLHELRTLGGNDLNRLVPELIAHLPQRFPTTVALFDWVLDRLEVFGPDAVRWWNIYLHLGRQGMSSGELGELLERKLGRGAARDAARIERGLRRYLQRRDGRLGYFHGQLRQAVIRRYLPPDTAGCHRELADYFDTRWPRANDHALRELLHHLLHANEWNRATTRLTDLRFLETKASAGQLFALVDDFTAAIQLLPGERPDATLVQLLSQAVEMDLNFLALHPSKLFQCLWNRCWWFDDAVVSHSPATTSDQGSAASTLRRLMEAWRSSKESTSPGFSWIRSLLPPSVPLSRTRANTIWGFRPLGFSPDSRYFLFDEGRTLGMWDLAQREIAVRLVGHDRPVRQAFFSADAERVLAPVGDDPARWCVWNAATGQLLTRVKLREKPRALQFSPAESRFTFQSGRDVVVCDAASGEETATIPGGASDWFTETFLLPGGERLLSHGRRTNRSALPPPLAPQWEDTIRVWDLLRGAELLRQSNVTNGFQCCAWSGDGQWLVTGWNDGTVRVWSTGDGSECGNVGRHRRRVTAVAIGPTSQIIVSAARDGTIRLWHRQDAREVWRMHIRRNTVSALAFSPDGRSLAAQCLDHTVRVWSIEDRREICRVRPIEWLNQVLEADPNFHQLRFSEDGQRLITRGAVQGVWNISYARYLGPENSISPNGRWRVSQMRATGHESGDILGQQFHKSVRAVHHTEEMNRLVIDDPECEWLEHSAHKESNPAPAPLRSVNQIAWSPTGDCLAASSESGIALGDPREGLLRRVLPHDGGAGLVFTPDGRWLIAGGAGSMSVTILKTETGQLRQRRLGHSNRINHIAYSPAARCIASCSSDGTIRVWDGDFLVRTVWNRLRDKGESACQTAWLVGWGILQSVWLGLHALLHLPNDPLRLPIWPSRAQKWCQRGHDGQVWRVAFSPDGQRLASGGQDATIRIWEVATGEPIRCLRGHTHGIQSLAYSQDGRQLISRGGDETIRVWDPATGDCRQVAPGHQTEFLAIADPQRFHWRGDVLVDTLSGAEIACHPLGSHDLLVADPSGRVWATSSGVSGDLFCFCLEGNVP